MAGRGTIPRKEERSQSKERKGKKEKERKICGTAAWSLVTHAGVGVVGTHVAGTHGLPSMAYVKGGKEMGKERSVCVDGAPIGSARRRKECREGRVCTWYLRERCITGLRRMAQGKLRAGGGSVCGVDGTEA